MKPCELVDMHRQNRIKIFSVLDDDTSDLKKQRIPLFFVLVAAEI